LRTLCSGKRSLRSLSDVFSNWALRAERDVVRKDATAIARINQRYVARFRALAEGAAMSELLHRYIDWREIDSDNWSGVRPHEWGEVIAKSHRFAEEAARRGMGVAPRKRPKRGDAPPPSVPNDHMRYREAATMMSISYRYLRNLVYEKRFTAEHGLVSIGPGKPCILRSVLQAAMDSGL
jgi:hypothetical protein